MQTNFSFAQRQDQDIRSSEQILRSCVHCGFCTATCPTYLETGDELDGPRGRIYLIKEMLETGGAPSPKTVRHLDRCLSCLSCMTTCPSSVNYMHLIDHGRAHIEANFERPWFDRLIRRLLTWALPVPEKFAWLMKAGGLMRPFIRMFRQVLPAPLRAAVNLIPRETAAFAPLKKGTTFPAEGERKHRIALIPGCVQQVLRPQINEATIRFLTRHGCEVVIAGDTCCGSLTHHMGKTDLAHQAARDHVNAVMEVHNAGELNAVIVNASGCGTTVKDYSFMLRGDDQVAADADFVSSLAVDISEFAAELDLAPPADKLPNLRVAYQSACSLQHGQKVHSLPIQLLRKAGFAVHDIPDAHLCCGSAGTYNILQSDMAQKLRTNKLTSIESVKPDVVATGNIGCLTQLAEGTQAPVVHTVELLDWATGGPAPIELSTT